MEIPGLVLTARADGVPWRATSSPGVSWLLLASEAEGADGDAPVGAAAGAGRGATVLIRMEPGRGYPPHRHLGVEEVLVLSGGYRDADGEHRAGDYVRYPPQSEHAPVALGDASRPAADDNPACILFAVARGGIAPLADDARRAEDSPAAQETRT